MRAISPVTRTATSTQRSAKIGERSKQLQNKRVRIEYHEEQRGQYDNTYPDRIEPAETQGAGAQGAAAPGADTDPQEAAWRTAVDAAPWLVGEPKEAVPAEERYEKPKPFEERVAGISGRIRAATEVSRGPRGKRILGLKRRGVMAQEPMEFAEFYASAKDDCLRAVLASTGDLQAAEDLVAEALARAWAAWSTVSRHPAPRAWVVRTALNTRVSWWRRRRHEVPLAQADVSASADTGHENGPVDEGLMAAVLRLPLRQRQVVGLRVFLDLDTAQTAQVLGIAPGTVTAHLARATAALREDALLTREQETQ